MKRLFFLELGVSKWGLNIGHNLPNILSKINLCQMLRPDPFEFAHIFSNKMV